MPNVYNYAFGVGNVKSYEVSGIPLVRIDTVPASGSALTASFSNVPKRVTIKNTMPGTSANVPIAFGFYSTSFANNECLVLNNQESFTGYLRPKHIFIQSENATAGSSSIVAEMTSITFDGDFQWNIGSGANDRAGIGNVGSYLVSGIPQVFGKRAVSSKTQIKFARITREVTIKNEQPPASASAPLIVGFSSLGIDGSNYFTLQNGESFTGEWRISSIWLKPSGTATSASIVAGLTNIVYNNDFTNWSGSVGVG